jgi:hypothetical protein
MPAIAWYGLQLVLFEQQKGEGAALARALGGDLKGKLSPFLYLAGIALAFVDTRVSDAIYVFVALLWLIPDRRIEKAMERR